VSNETVFELPETPLVAAAGAADSVRALCSTMSAGLSSPQDIRNRLGQAKKLAFACLAFLKTAEEIYDEPPPPPQAAREAPPSPEMPPKGPPKGHKPRFRV
jgi:hypothetical protein